MDFVDKLASAGKLTPDQVQRIRQDVYEFMKHADENPDFHREALSKLGATGGQFWKDLGIGTAAGVAATAIATGLGLAGKKGLEHYEKYRNKHDFKAQYDSMLATNPHLKNHDQNRVKIIFGTLQTFNPAYAKDPLVAGTFVQNAIDMDRVDVNTINAIVTAREKLRSAEEKERGGLGASQTPGYMSFAASTRNIRHG